MKIKLWERTAFRVIIFFLCGIFLAGAVCMAQFGVKRLAELEHRHMISVSASDYLSVRGFFESETLRKAFSDKAHTLVYLYENFADKGDARITEGEVYEHMVDVTVRSLYMQLQESLEGLGMYMEEYGGNDEASKFPYSNFPPYTDYPPYSDYTYDGKIFFSWDPLYGERFEFDTTKILENPALVQNGRMKAFDEDGVRETFIDTFPLQIASVRQMIAGVRQSDYNETVRMLEGALYFVSDGERTLSNIELGQDGYPDDEKGLTEKKLWVKIENREIASSLANFVVNADMWPEIGRTTLYYAWPDERTTAIEGLYYESRRIALTYFITALALAILAIVCLIMSFVFTGRKRPAYDDTRRLWACDKIFVEFQLIVLFFLFTIGGALVSEFLFSGRYFSSMNYELYVVFAAVIGLVLTLAILWFLLSLIRLGKAGLIAKRSLICLFVYGPASRLGDTIKSGYDGRNPLAKAIMLVALLWFLTALFSGICGVSLMRGGQGGAAIFFVILLLVTLAGALRITRRWAERYGHLRRGVEEIAGGNLGYRIEIEGDGKNEFDRLSAMVNELGSAQNTAIQNELKNQRLKTDLISNVSHDLKTPLTSIITYTDLLKTEGLKSKNAEEYLTVIDEKGRRLQKLTEDLFDAAKASSGALNVRKEKVDLLALLNQEIAEANGSFDDAGLSLVIDAPEDNYYVEADGQLLWRVVDNLLRNARKYAQPGTRVYVELRQQLPSGIYRQEGPSGAEQAGARADSSGAMTALEIKNTSATRLNISPEELMERFKRGDESRASEGSGLGLAIAKDLVRLQGGRFEIFIDGDLFKAVVMLPPHTG